jgi:hypothetical protein
MKARRGSRDLVLLILSLGSTWRLLLNITLRPLYSRKRTAVSIKVKTGWAAEPLWTRLEMKLSSPIGLRTPLKCSKFYTNFSTGTRVSYSIGNRVALGQAVMAQKRYMAFASTEDIKGTNEI